MGPPPDTPSCPRFPGKRHQEDQDAEKELCLLPISREGTSFPHAALSRLPLRAPAHTSQPLPPSCLSEKSAVICLFNSARIEHLLCAKH